MKLRIFLASLVLAILASSSIYAQSSASGMFTVQGRVTNTNNVAIADGPHRIMTNVYVKGNATAIYTQTDTLATTDGIFTVMLGAAKKLTLDSKSSYEVGVSVDGAPELQPHIPMGYAPRSMTALVADSTLIADNLSAAGIANLAATVGQNVVTSVNGQHGAVTILGGGALGVSTANDTVQLNFSGSGTGLLLPFLDTLPLPLFSKFTIVNPSNGQAATFQNKGTGTALRVQSAAGSAISAQSAGGGATIDVVNTGGAAVNALSTTGNAFVGTTNAGDVAALYLKNTGSGFGRLIRGDNSTGYPVIDVTNLGTTINGVDTASAGAVLKLQQRSRLGSALLIASDSANNALFSVSRLGATSVNSSAATALNVAASNGRAINATAYNQNGAAFEVMNTVNPTNSNALILAARDSAGATIMKVSANGTTALSSNRGMALSVLGTNASGAAAQVQNISSASSSALVAKDSAGNTILNAAGSGTTIASYGAASAATSLAVNASGAVLRSNAATALYDSTTSGNTAARLVGGLSLVGPVGTGTIATGNGSVTINNAYAKANSIIFLTVASNATSLVPLRLASTSNGSFVVALLGSSSLANDLTFNYLIINQ
jgi:hypothetical protein